MIPLLAAVLRVVAQLVGATEATIGHRVDGRLVALRLALPDGSWLDLMRATAAALSADLPGVTPDVVVDCEFGVDASLVVVPVGEETLRLGYRVDRFDAAHARRLGGYFVRALTAMADEPHGPHAALELLGPAEHRQTRAFGRGARRELPDRRFHHLFTAQARRTPDAVAAVHAGATLTYEELEQRSNQVANGLLEAGLAAEDVVAVATERHLDWLAAILGVLKAGGAYLPVEPAFPAARIATLLAESRCAVVLSDAAGSTSVTQAATRPEVAAVRHLPLAMTRANATEPPGVAIEANRLAYIYFTSGSTGRPKGAMCEHLGLLNHLFAKVDDLQLGPADVVVQNAQQSFDISLWQLLAPLLAGGRTLIVEPEAVLDPRRFVDTLVGSGATVLQVVPSYLDILLRQAEHSRAGLRGLRAVSVTGEAISRSLVSRWFAAYPAIPLVNAYGATEASDDTTHEVLTEPPAAELVPVGRPVSNVDVYVLGPADTLLPLGSVGEIAFAGVCVGRGYINAPSGTAFGNDPWQPGVRLYRTGDFGRWLPSGTLEFHGRRDDQVKIRGVRIELGEVENRILEHPRVGHAAVVTVPEPGEGKALAAFYTTRDGAEPLSADDLTDHLASVLPASAVPSRVIRLDALPLNDNGKVDRKALIAQASTTAGRSEARSAPQTPTERRIAEVWAMALHRPAGGIGRDDHFFDLGGTSLTALRVVATLGGLVSLDDLLRTPVLRTLAAAADGELIPAAGLLRRLTDGARARVVGLPYAAGTALDFRPLAAAVAERDASIAVYAVQPPGHDLASANEVLLDVPRLANAVADELADGTVPVVLWGHCTGAATALEVARRLEARGRAPAHLILAALLDETDDERARQNAIVSVAGDTDLARELPVDGVAELNEHALAAIGRVYRHDTRAANEYLTNVAQAWAGYRLTTPVTVAVSTTDTSTAGYEQRFAAWSRLAATVRLAAVEGGGHYFMRTRAAACAELAIRNIREPVGSSAVAT
jgi:amino acid adenylation domain-containing protein